MDATSPRRDRLRRRCDRGAQDRWAVSRPVGGRRTGLRPSVGGRALGDEVRVVVGGSQLGGQREQLSPDARPTSWTPMGTGPWVFAGPGVRHVVGTVIAGSPIMLHHQVHGVYWHRRL
ncbi:hypothetical protein QJS66_10340 [Kocuria rhizophila]|nr:hypothetical protein QJS66_10340 [Kocuria rhizophila]